MKTADTVTPGKCPPPEDVVAFVMNGDIADYPHDLAGHIAQCEACQRLAEETDGTRKTLRLDADPPVRDLTAVIMAKLPANAWASPEHQSTRGLLLHWRIPLRLAASLAILLGAAYIMHRNKAPTRPMPSTDPTTLALQAGHHWLVEHQQSSGGWDAVKLGGRPEYTEALNGLAVMAIITAGPPRNADTLATLGRAADYMLARQTQDGLISQDAGAAMYNHGIATLALLEIDRLTGDRRLDVPINKALAIICSRQSPLGGWGYRDDPASPPNTAITAWQVKALLQARTQGRDVPVATLRKALNWMAGTVGPQGHFGYEGPQTQTDNHAVLTMMGAHCLFAARDSDLMNDPQLEASVKTAVRRLAQEPPGDYHQAYFMASVIEQLGDQPSMAESTSLRQKLLARQIRTGTEAGTWQTADDRWGSTGGKLYSTSMAMLTLCHQGRRPDILL